MEKNRERSDKVRLVVSRLLAALALAAFVSYPATAAIKRFTDEKGTLHISNEGGEGKPPTPLSSPPRRPPRVRTPPGVPGGPGVAPPPPPPQAAPAPPPPRAASPEPEDQPEDIVEEQEDTEESLPPKRGPRR